MSTDDQPDLDPQLAEAVRRAYVQPLDEATARRHVSAITAATTGEAVRPPVRSRRRAWRAAAAGVAATLLLPVGLAVAGVSLPQAVSRPYRSIGVPLPHQPRHDTQPTTTPQLIPRVPTSPGTSTTPRDTNRPATAPPRDRPNAGRDNGADRSKSSPKDKQGKSTPSSGGARGTGAKPPPGTRGAAGNRAKRVPRTPAAAGKPKLKRPQVRRALGQAGSSPLTTPFGKSRQQGNGAASGAARKP